VEESIKTLRDSSDFQYQKRLLHFRAIRSDMNISDPRPGHLRHNRLLSSAQALQMSGIESLEQGSLEDGKLMLKEASEIYEHLVSLEEYSAEIKLELLLLAAITASLSDYQANAFVLSNNLPQSLNELTQNLRDNYSAFSILAILLLRRQIGAAKDFISEEMDSLPVREQSLIDRMQTQDNEYPTSDPIIDGWRFLCLKYYLQACNQFIRYLEFGENDAFEEATRLLNRVLEIFLTEGDVEYWYIVHAVRALTIRIRERSIWTNLYTKLSTPLVHQYCYNLVSVTHHRRSNGSLFELWPSQITAIDKGLLDVNTDNLIIRLPTSTLT
jgi:tetratricopeptide (TPR) repeat protein